MIELTILFLGLSISFALLTGLVLRKSRNVSNLAFTVTTGLFTINTFASFLQEAMRDTIIPQSDVLSIQLRMIGDIAYLIAPLGLAYSSFMIVNGYSEYKNRNLTIFTLVYLLTGLIFILINDPFVSIIIEEKPNPFLNLIDSIPLIISLYYFGKLYKLVDAANTTDKRKVLYLVLGIFVGTSGQVINTINVFLNQDTLPIALAIIIVGVLSASISFTNLSGRVHPPTPQTESTPSPN
ncbi:MAG: hypothetical protein ACXADY_11695 [Candidatus Hodarchaeales archaeon]